MKRTIGILVLTAMLFLPQGVSAQTHIGDPHALRAMLTSFAKNLMDMSAMLVPIAERLAAKSEDKAVEHVLILNDLLLIKTIIDYEVELSQTYGLIRNDAQIRYFEMRVEEMAKSREKIRLAFQRINRHAARFLPADGSPRQGADVEELLAINDLTNTVQKVLVLFNMSVEYIQSALSPTQNRRRNP